MGVPLVRSGCTIEEYLRMEETSLEKHEYHAGQVYAMSEGTYAASRIGANVIGELRQRLKGKPCYPLESNMRLAVGRTARYFYPDSMIVCGPPRFDAVDGSETTINNPTVIIEVLSPSTEGYDRGERFDHYRELESLKEYVLVAQHKPAVEVFLRQDDGTWLFSPYMGLQHEAALRSVGVTLPLREVYAGIEFPEVPPPPAGLRPA